MRALCVRACVRACMCVSRASLKIIMHKSVNDLHRYKRHNFGVLCYNPYSTLLYKMPYLHNIEASMLWFSCSQAHSAALAIRTKHSLEC